MKRTPSKQPPGFTLVELLIYILLAGMALGAIYGLLINNVKSHASQANTLEMVQDLRSAMDFMVREIRMAGCDPTGAGGFGFLDDASDENHDTDADSISFNMDLNDDGDDDDTHESIRYYADTVGGVVKIMRQTTGSPQPVAEGIQSLTFQYWDVAGNLLDLDTTPGDRDEIRTVQIQITAETDEIDPVTRQKKQRVMSSRIRVRNAGL
jgi:type IV pilus assembly protein PilW